MTGLTSADAEALLYREALLLDRRDFDAWLELYLPDALYWMPAWRDEGEQTEDPDRELSLIYYHGRRNLEDRIKRLRSGQSVASLVLPRVVHAVTNILVEAGGADGAEVSSCFTVHQFDVRANRSHVVFGRYEHRLARVGGEWKIAAKIIRLLNDVVPTVLDIYAI